MDRRDVDPIEGERFDRGRWPFPGRGEQGTRQLGVDAAKFLGPVPAGETVHGHATADADRAGFDRERHALEQETAAEHIKNALQLLTGNGDEDRAHLLVLMDAARARLQKALEALDRGR